MSVKKYAQYVQVDSDFKPIDNVSVIAKLPPGVYQLKRTMQGDIFFSKVNVNYDQIMHLPNTAYDEVIRDLVQFCDDLGVDARLKEQGYLRKFSMLAHGPHGSGKTMIVNRATEVITARGGVVLFCPDPRLLVETFKILDSIQPQTPLMIIFEELDELLECHEDELLSLLDGEVQRNNIIYMATTNNIDRIPPRIRRPSRFASVIKVDYPSPATRLFYLEQKLGGKGFDLLKWVEKTANFSIDELKETVKQVYCYQKNLDETVRRILENKGILSSAHEPKQEKYDDVEMLMRNAKQELAKALSADEPAFPEEEFADQS